MLDDVLYPGVATGNWAMLPAEKMALTGLLARIKPRHALEIGTYFGGSLTLISQFAEKVWALDIDPDVPNRFKVPENVDLRIAQPEGLVGNMLNELEEKDIALDFVLIDADHSTEGVRRDIEAVIHRPVPPKKPMMILMHDASNPGCREGMKTASWAACPYVHSVDLDFVPGQVQTLGSPDNPYYEVWGGFGMGYLLPTPREGELKIQENAIKTINALHAAVR